MSLRKRKSLSGRASPTNDRADCRQSRQSEQGKAGGFGSSGVQRYGNVPRDRLCRSAIVDRERNRLKRQCPARKGESLRRAGKGDLNAATAGARDRTGERRDERRGVGGQSCRGGKGRQQRKGIAREAAGAGSRS